MTKSTLSRQNLPIVERLKTSYSLWYKCYQILVKAHRFTLGQRVDDLFVETIEAVATAVFLPPDKKISYVQLAIRKVETIKMLLMILWENDSLENKKYLELSQSLDEIGKMLGGWNGQLTRQLAIKNSPAS